MKNTNRIHKNGARKYVQSQGKSNTADKWLEIKDYGLSEFENAVSQSNALLQLLDHNMDWQANRSGSEFNGEYINRFCGGISELVAQTQNRLNKAFNATFSAIHPKRVEVAS